MPLYVLFAAGCSKVTQGHW